MNVLNVITRLLLTRPFYGQMAGVLALQETPAQSTLKVVWFPSPVLQVNPGWFESLTPEEAEIRVMHELLHLCLMHPLRRGSRDPLLWDLACDLAVNSLLPPAMLPPEAVTPERAGKALHLNLLPLQPAEIYYEALGALEDGAILLDEDTQIRIPVRDGPDMTVNRLDTQMSEVSGVAVQALEHTLFQTLHRAMEESGVPEGLTLQTDAVFARCRTDWRTLFKRFLTGRGRMDSRRSYKRDSRRYEGFPGNKRSIGLRCLLAIDESGSVPNRQVEAFYRELVQISRITGAEMLLTTFDTECTPPVPLAHFRLSNVRTKNGGTDFHPVFALADQLRMELVVIFTDGDGPAPEHVHQKVLWILTTRGKAPAPYGLAVKLDEP